MKESHWRRSLIKIKTLEQLTEQSKHFTESQIMEQGQKLESFKKQIAEYENEIEELTETNEEL